MAARGVPAGVADITLGLYLVSRHGEIAAVDPTLERLLGRPATPLRDVLKAAISPAG